MSRQFAVRLQVEGRLGRQLAVHHDANTLIKLSCLSIQQLVLQKQM